MTVAVNDIKDERILKSPPAIQPVPPGTARPLWSVMIPVYNGSRFLPATLKSVLDQDPGPAIMQIEVVDDCSTDVNVEQLVRQLAGNRVQYYRQPRNIGSLRNFLTCLDRSKGRLIHLLHGDDLVRRGFYERIGSFFARYTSIGAAFCRYAYIDEHGTYINSQPIEMEREGILDNWVERLCERQRIQYAAIVVKREVYETLGGFYGAEYGEDWEMWVRIAAQYDIGYIPETLAEYRRHLSSISGNAFLNGTNMTQLLWVMDHIRRYLPPAKRARVMEKSRRFYANYALNVANTLWKELHHRSGAEAQVKAAWMMKKDITLLYKILKLYTRMALNI
jgi:glycosyltransferase involved in cell wall biosynthesis